MTWPARIGLFQFLKCGTPLLEPVRARIGVYPEEGETVRKVKHSSMRIENLLLALCRSTEYFSLARTFRTVWGAESVQQKSQDASGNDDGYRSYLEEK